MSDVSSNNIYLATVEQVFWQMRKNAGRVIAKCLTQTHRN